MTKEEWNMLVDWVYSGHSPYTNGDGVFDDDGSIPIIHKPKDVAKNICFMKHIKGNKIATSAVFNYRIGYNHI